MWFLIGRPLGSVRSPARNGVATSIGGGWLIPADIRVATVLLLVPIAKMQPRGGKSP
jgi:hypothetical protein